MSGNNNASTGTVVKLSSLDEKIQNLIKQATETRNNAYAPYSKFQVGASILCKDGTIFSGCNVENNSYTVGTCGERCAYFKAISEGRRDFVAIAIVAYQEDDFTTPCGACRQFMCEFDKVDVYMTKPQFEDVLVSNSDDLLPLHFSLKNFQ